MAATNPDAHVVAAGALTGRHALITGAGSGIGRAIALGLAAAGADVALVGRRPEPLAAVAAEITAANPDRVVVTEAVDVRELEQVDAALDRVLATFGALEILVNNTGG